MAENHASAAMRAADAGRLFQVLARFPGKKPSAAVRAADAGRLFQVLARFPGKKPFAAVRAADAFSARTSLCSAPAESR